MTESAVASTASPQQLDRLAALQSRRAASSASAQDSGSTAGAAAQRAKRRRRHAAPGGRIVAAGLGATTMLGIVTVLGLDNPVIGAGSSTVPTTELAPVVVAAPPVQVVIHRVPATASLAADTSTEVAAPAAPAGSAPAPVQLTAEPVIQTVTVVTPSQPRSSSQISSSPAPAATTSGSS